MVKNVNNFQKWRNFCNELKPNSFIDQCQTTYRSFWFSKVILQTFYTPFRSFNKGMSILDALVNTNVTNHTKLLHRKLFKIRIEQVHLFYQKKKVNQLDKRRYFIQDYTNNNKIHKLEILNQKIKVHFNNEILPKKTSVSIKSHRSSSYYTRAQASWIQV